MILYIIKNLDQSDSVFNSYRGLGRVLKFALFG